LSGFKKTCISIGASNAGYTAAALESKGVRTVSASVPGWRITRDNVEEVLRTVQKEYREGDILLIQCLKNSTYLFHAQHRNGLHGITGEG
jgi:hypothetical protein